MGLEEVLDTEQAAAYLKCRTGDDLLYEIDLPGVFAVLGRLGPSTVITLPGLAEILGKHPSSVQRAVDKGQLPEPVKLLSSPIWTHRVLICHIEDRLAAVAEQAAVEREQEARRERETNEAEHKLLTLSP